MKRVTCSVHGPVWASRASYDLFMRPMSHSILFSNNITLYYLTCYVLMCALERLVIYNVLMFRAQERLVIYNVLMFRAQGRPAECWACVTASSPVSSVRTTWPAAPYSTSYPGSAVLRAVSGGGRFSSGGSVMKGEISRVLCSTTDVVKVKFSYKTIDSSQQLPTASLIGCHIQGDQKKSW